jgi:DNA modification methylase
MIDLRQGDCLEIMKDIPNNSIDLVVIDPPYLIENTKAGGNSKLAKSIQGMNNEIKENNLTNGFDIKCLDELFRVMKKPNIYIWCNHKQIPMYLDYFVKEKDCSFDIIIWNKTNAMPLFNNKYLTDKEYCLYFRKGGYCNPNSYIDAKTVYYQPINIKDKRLYNHPTIKPLNIIETIIKNSSNENDTVLDCFMGSGTTGVACVNTNRNFIGIELDETYFNIAKERISSIRDEDI